MTMQDVSKMGMQILCYFSHTYNFFGTFVGEPQGGEEDVTMRDVSKKGMQILCYFSSTYNFFLDICRGDSGQQR